MNTTICNEDEEDLTPCHKMHVTAKYFQMLKTGEKRAEFRLLDEKRQVIQVGDFIDFFCQDSPVQAFRLKVAEIIIAPTFKALLDLVPPSLLGGIPKQKQLLDLEKFYEQRVTRYQVIALLLEENE